MIPPSIVEQNSVFYFWNERYFHKFLQVIQVLCLHVTMQTGGSTTDGVQMSVVGSTPSRRFNSIERDFFSSTKLG